MNLRQLRLLGHAVRYTRPHQLAHRLKALSLLQSLFGDLPLRLALLERLGPLAYQLLEMFTIALQFRFVALLLGNVLALNEDADHLPIVLDDRLQDEIEDDLFGLPLRLPPQKQ